MIKFQCNNLESIHSGILNAIYSCSTRCKLSSIVESALPLITMFKIDVNTFTSILLHLGYTNSDNIKKQLISLQLNNKTLQSGMCFGYFTDFYYLIHRMSDEHIYFYHYKHKRVITYYWQSKLYQNILNDLYYINNSEDEAKEILGVIVSLLYKFGESEMCKVIECSTTYNACIFLCIIVKLIEHTISNRTFYLND